MQSDGILKHFALAFVLALIFYFGSFAYIQHRRHFRGPWQVEFVSDAHGQPSINISEPYLQITQRIDFSGQTIAATNLSQTVPFPEAVTNVPFGKMLFQDPTFLPGTVTMSLFGHEIELLPRVLIVDKKEIAWGSQKEIAVK
jgi:hypothetical protein